MQGKRFQRAPCKGVKYMGAKTDELIYVLSELSGILEKNENHHWAQWIRSAESRLTHSDYSGIEKILLAYGGIGSFNDIYIQSSRELDVRFAFLRTKAWELANYIKRNHEINAQSGH